MARLSMLAHPHADLASVQVPLKLHGLVHPAPTSCSTGELIHTAAHYHASFQGGEQRRHLAAPFGHKPGVAAGGRLTPRPGPQPRVIKLMCNNREIQPAASSSSPTTAALAARAAGVLAYNDEGMVVHNLAAASTYRSAAPARWREPVAAASPCSSPRLPRGRRSPRWATAAPAGGLEIRACSGRGHRHGQHGEPPPAEATLPPRRPSQPGTQQVQDDQLLGHGVRLAHDGHGWSSSSGGRSVRGRTRPSPAMTQPPQRRGGRPPCSRWLVGSILSSAIRDSPSAPPCWTCPATSACARLRIRRVPISTRDVAADPGLPQFSTARFEASFACPPGARAQRLADHFSAASRRGASRCAPSPRTRVAERVPRASSRLPRPGQA